MNPIGIIGTGNMGSALVRGLVNSGRTSGDKIIVYDVDPVKTQALVRDLGVVAVDEVRATVPPATGMVVLAVKPQVLGDVAQEIADKISDRPVVVSIAAGTSTQFILSFLKAGARVVRAMPNAAAMVGQSVTAICKAGLADDQDLEDAREIFDAFGTTVLVDEKMMNVVTAISGSGPGYLFALMEAMTDGGVLMGLDRPTARELTVRTFAGAAALASRESAAFSALKDRITSPGGTTIAGLHELETSAMRGAMMKVIQAATRRGEELQARE